ncbi:hypothetical protein [Comamonas sp. GB3 AK4-5]|uniref:hypothetical protein n=1 Tax=Comamonas sp. GB3 AK4-5 TaxID=3231487 RepID=UPI00351E34D7
MMTHTNAALMAVQAQPCLLNVQEGVEELQSARSALRALTQLVSVCAGPQRSSLPVAAHDLAQLLNVVDAEIARCTRALATSVDAVRMAQEGGAA